MFVGLEEVTELERGVAMMGFENENQNLEMEVLPDQEPV